MIVSIQGQIIDKKPDSVIININGLGYLCFISANTYSNLPSKNQEVFQVPAPAGEAQSRREL